jgi:signal transduction histidine kinase
MRNAIQHGDPTVPIELTATGDGDVVRLEVHNGGPPIPGRALTTMFDPMIRHASDDQRTSGLGLGLYIASQIVTAHGGKLDVTSTESEGTTFRVQLPRKPATKMSSE